jgi:alpha-N-arabinofuranosidase
MTIVHLRLRETPVGPISPRLFGGFLEHLGRAVYGGIYEPGHPTADADGFRQDVLALVRELGVTVVRYPGGNFVSGYRWEDGVGPRAERPQRLDLAWHSLEPNEVGLAEFLRWADLAGVEPMLAVNLGTRGIAEAVDLIEYCNANRGSLADQRRQHGAERPYGIKLWCLGNEMDGPWQLGHRSAEAYAALAERTAHALRLVDDSIELVACGSSGPGMPTFGTWEETVLRAGYDRLDYLSCHQYFEEHDGDIASFLASGVEMDRFIEQVADLCDSVGRELGSAKRLGLSFDEWNVWHMERDKDRDTITGADNWPFAPPLLEESYTVTDAVVVGSLLISLLSHADRVQVACLAQIVNAIAPIMTVTGGPAWRQTTFHPFALTAPMAGGTAYACDSDGPSVTTQLYGTVPALQAVAVADDQGDLTIFAVNRSTTDALDLVVDQPGVNPVAVTLLADSDPTAVNSAVAPQRVVPRTTLQPAGEAIHLPPMSWVRVTWSP